MATPSFRVVTRAVISGTSPLSARQPTRCGWPPFHSRTGTGPPLPLFPCPASRRHARARLARHCLRVARAIVEARVDELLQEALVPCVEEVGVRGEHAARREVHSLPAGERVADGEPNQGHLDRMRRRAYVVATVRHVAPVVAA